MIGFVAMFIASVAHAGALGPWRDDPLEIDQASPVAALLDASAPQCSALYRNMQQLPERPDLYTLANPQNAWGAAYMGDLLVAAAEEMAILLPDADPILIGDISRRGGGQLTSHISHQQGIDADLGLYQKGGKQGTIGFSDLTASNIDYEASWLLIKSLLDSGRIEFILLDGRVISLLRDWTVENGRLTRDEALRIFPKEGTPRLWEQTGYVRHAANHRDHIHVRVRCEDGSGTAEE